MPKNFNDHACSLGLGCVRVMKLLGIFGMSLRYLIIRAGLAKNPRTITVWDLASSPRKQISRSNLCYPLFPTITLLLLSCRSRWVAR